MVASGARFGTFQSGKNKGRQYYEIRGTRRLVGSGGLKDPLKAERRAHAQTAAREQQARDARTLVELQGGEPMITVRQPRTRRVIRRRRGIG